MDSYYRNQVLDERLTEMTSILRQMVAQQVQRNSRSYDVYSNSVHSTYEFTSSKDNSVGRYDVAAAEFFTENSYHQLQCHPHYSDPYYSNTYCPESRDDSNMLWGSLEQQQQQYDLYYQDTQPRMQQPQSGPSLEELVKQMATSSMQFQQDTKQFQQRTKATIQTLQTQVEQLASSVSHMISNPMQYPYEEHSICCDAVINDSKEDIHDESIDVLEVAIHDDTTCIPVDTAYIPDDVSHVHDDTLDLHDEIIDVHNDALGRQDDFVKGLPLHNDVLSIPHDILDMHDTMTVVSDNTPDRHDDILDVHDDVVEMVNDIVDRPLLHDDEGTCLPNCDPNCNPICFDCYSEHDRCHVCSGLHELDDSLYPSCDCDGADLCVACVEIAAALVDNTDCVDTIQSNDCVVQESLQIAGIKDSVSTSIPPIQQPSIKASLQSPTLDLKPLSKHFTYTHLDAEELEESRGWICDDMRGLEPLSYTHYILKEGAKPKKQLNPLRLDIVRGVFSFLSLIISILVLEFTCYITLRTMLSLSVGGKIFLLLLLGCGFHLVLDIDLFLMLFCRFK